MSQIFHSFEANNELFNENEREIWPKWIFRTSAWMHVGRAMQEQLPSRFFYSRTASYRLARSFRYLQNLVHDLKSKEIALKVIEQPIDTSTAAGKYWVLINNP